MRRAEQLSKNYNIDKEFIITYLSKGPMYPRISFSTHTNVLSPLRKSANDSKFFYERTIAHLRDTPAR